MFPVALATQIKAHIECQALFDLVNGHIQDRLQEKLKKTPQNYQNHQIPNLPQKTKMPKIPHQKAPFSNSKDIKSPHEKKGEGEYFSSL